MTDPLTTPLPLHTMAAYGRSSASRVNYMHLPLLKGEHSDLVAGSNFKALAVKLKVEDANLAPPVPTSQHRRVAPLKHHETRSDRLPTYIVLFEGRVDVEVPVDGLGEQRRLVGKTLELRWMMQSAQSHVMTWCAALSAGVARWPSCHATRL